MFMLMQAMKFAHLPEPGGLYDQHPEFLERVYYIFQQQGEEDKRQEAKRNRPGNGRPRVAGQR